MTRTCRGRTFYCWHCALMEGVLASFPELTPDLEVRQIAFARPRRDVTRLIGEANQSLRVLVLAEDAPADLPAAVHEGRRFVNEPMAILDILHRRHGYPPAHP